MHLTNKYYTMLFAMKLFSSAISKFEAGNLKCTELSRPFSKKLLEFHIYCYYMQQLTLHFKKYFRKLSVCKDNWCVSNYHKTDNSDQKYCASRLMVRVPTLQ